MWSFKLKFDIDIDKLQAEGWSFKLQLQAENSRRIPNPNPAGPLTRARFWIITMIEKGSMKRAVKNEMKVKVIYNCSYGSVSAYLVPAC